VNRALVELLRRKESELQQRGIAWRITGVATRKTGWLADAKGFDLNVLLGKSSALPGWANPLLRDDFCDWLSTARANVLLEAISLDPYTGQPAIEYLRAALNMGIHAITANKGPVVHAYRELSTLAAEKGKQFLFESTVMDGVPIFSLFRDHLHGVQVHGFRGILNSTTNVILSGMESGLTFDQALKRAQDVGVAETNPSHDIDGWDATMKVAALVTVVMNTPIRPDQVQREGIRGLNADQVFSAHAAGHPYRLVCRAHRSGEQAEASVRPEQVPANDPLAQVTGTSSVVYFETDIFPGLIITEVNPGVEATAYGMYADFVRAVGTGKAEV